MTLMDSEDDFRSGCRNVSKMSPKTVLLWTTLTRVIIICVLMEFGSVCSGIIKVRSGGVRYAAADF